MAAKWPQQPQLVMLWWLCMLFTGTYNDFGWVFFSLCSVSKSRTKYSYWKSLIAIFTVLKLHNYGYKLNNKNKINIYSRQHMKIVLIHRKMDHWTGYSPLADSCVIVTSSSQNFLFTVHSKSYCHLMYGWIVQNIRIPSLGCRWWWPMGQTGDEMRGSLRSAHRQIGTT